MASTKTAVILLALFALCNAQVSLTKKDLALSHLLGVRRSSSGAGTLGVVNPTVRCGGVATPLELRISDCQGYCRFQPGTLYNCEKDFMPSSSSPSLSLKVEVCLRPTCFTILETVIPNSSVQPGFVYTAKYGIVPNDVFSGNTIQFYAYIFHTDNLLLEVCVGADVDIL